MKKNHFKRIMSCMLAFILLFMPVSNVQASTSSNMEKVIKYYAKGNIKKAEKYNAKLPKYANEACVKKMSARMKTAYLKVVKKYAKKTKSPYMRDYYLTDIDNDNKAELVIIYYAAEAHCELIVYKYKGGKAKKIASTYGGSSSSFHAYPGHKGLIQLHGKMGSESINIITVKDGKINVKYYGRGERVLTYFPLRLQLKSHVKYSNGKFIVEYRELK